MSAHRQSDIHRDLHSHSAVELVGEGGRAVVTGHVVFEDEGTPSQLLLVC